MGIWIYSVIMPIWIWNGICLWSFLLWSSNIMQKIIAQKIPIWEEEERQIVRDYNEFEGGNIDEEEFAQNAVIKMKINIIFFKNN